MTVERTDNQVGTLPLEDITDEVESSQSIKAGRNTKGRLDSVIRISSKDIAGIIEKVEDPTFLNPERKSRSVSDNYFTTTKKLDDEVNDIMERAESDKVKTQELISLLERFNIVQNYLEKISKILKETAEGPYDIIPFRMRNELNDFTANIYNFNQRNLIENERGIEWLEFKLLEDIQNLSQEDIQNLKISSEKRKKISLIHDYVHSKSEIQEHWAHVKSELDNLDDDNDLEKSAYNVAVEMASFAATSKIQLLMATKMPILEKVIGKKKSRVILMSLVSPIKASLKVEITSIPEREKSIEESNKEMKKALKKSVLDAIDGADYIDSGESMEAIKKEVDQVFESIGVSGIIEDIDKITNNIPVVGNFKTMLGNIFKTAKAPIDIMKFEIFLKRHEEKIQSNYEFINGEIDELLEELVGEKNKS